MILFDTSLYVYFTSPQQSPKQIQKSSPPINFMHPFSVEEDNDEEEKVLLHIIIYCWKLIN